MEKWLTAPEGQVRPAEKYVQEHPDEHYLDLAMRLHEGGESWETIATSTPWTPTGLVRKLERAGLYKKKPKSDLEAERKKVDAIIPEVIRLRQNGMSLTKALAETGISISQYNSGITRLGYNPFSRRSSRK